MPRVVILGGVNGAGKSTVAKKVLNALKIPTFVNADDIARGLNAQNPEAVAFQAGRIMLNWVHQLADEHKDFAFETTLAARTYASWLKSLKVVGYHLTIIYCWLPSSDVAVARVRQRVIDGGHNIPERDIRRRYGRSVNNFLTLYRPIADYWELHDNTRPQRNLVAIGDAREMLYVDENKWDRVQKSANDHEPNNS
jgi:predicted ABC-type ATPase